jgi:hypothetical protein
VEETRQGWRMRARWLCCLANLNSLIGGQSCSPVMRMFASIHFPPPSTSCLHPLPASTHFLPPSTSCLHPLPAFIHFLPSSTCFSTYRRLCSVQPVQHILLQRVVCMEHLMAKQKVSLCFFQRTISAIQGLIDPPKDLILRGHERKHAQSSIRLIQQECPKRAGKKRLLVQK